MDKRQVVVIHGGETFETKEEYLSWLRTKELDFEKMGTKRWKSSLQTELGEYYEIIQPGMPNALDAKYEEWKIWFEKYLPYLADMVILVGHSLGAIFLVKYLSENDLGKEIKGLLLVAAPFGNTDTYSLADFNLPDDLSRVESQCRHIQLYHSTDDPVVPFSDLAKYQAKLPRARASIFADREHFNQETFPELVEDIRLLG